MVPRPQPRFSPTSTSKPRIHPRSENEREIIQLTSAPPNLATVPLAELAQLYDVHPNKITAWKAHLLEGAAEMFGPGSVTKEAAPAIDVKTLHAKIGELTLENDFLSGALGKAGRLSAKR